MSFHESESLYAIFAQVIRFHYYRTHRLLENSGVYPGQHPLLFALGKQDGQSQRDLAERLHIAPATLTVMITRMEKANLVERRQKEDDQRVTNVFLTEQGKIVRSKAVESMKIIQEELFNNFSEEEKLLLRRLFMQMKNNLETVCGKY